MKPFILLQVQNKAYRLGTHRCLTPEETLARVQPLLESMGITRVANVTGLDRVGIPVYNAFRPLSRSISVSQGKGSELLAAKVSAIMESVETYHAENILNPLRQGSIEALETEIRLADTDSMARCGPHRLPRDQSIAWIEARNLADGKGYWLPFELVSTSYTLPSPPGYGYFAANTNGLASGNSRDEALCHAIYEVVERDAEALWSQLSSRNQATTGVDPETIDDPNCCWLLEQFRLANVDVKIWDLSCDTGLPCFTCLALGDEQDWADPEFGTGCHANREIALARALSEAAQARATFIAGSRDDVGITEYRHTMRQQRRAQGLRQRQAHLPARRFDELVSLQNDYIEEDLRRCVHQLQAIDMQQVLYIDLSQPQLGLPVVKVIVPGLEGAYGHHRNTYAPGPRARAQAGG